MQPSRVRISSSRTGTLRRTGEEQEEQPEPQWRNLGRSRRNNQNLREGTWGGPGEASAVASRTQPVLGPVLL
ncbi:unnamed protein product [Boreogadus saida]